MQILDVNRAIMFGTFTNDELNSVIDAVKFARAQLQQQVRRRVTLGSTVKFFNARHNVQVQGNVEKIARKYISVRTANQGVWRVPANMIELV